MQEQHSLSMESLMDVSWSGHQSWMFCFLPFALKERWKQQEWSICRWLFRVQESQWREFKLVLMQFFHWNLWVVSFSSSSLLIFLFQLNLLWILYFWLYFYFQVCILFTKFVVHILFTDLYILHFKISGLALQHKVVQVSPCSKFSDKLLSPILCSK